MDSSVAALLVHRAVGEQLTCVFVDHGLMRKDEGEQVIRHLPRHASRSRSSPSTPSSASSTKLQGVVEPEAKRKVIGEEFIRVFEEEARRLADDGDGAEARFLVQGTLYSDVIESGGGTGAATIKSHHNVGGPAQRPALRARRAAAGAVQGRGPRGRRTARACPSSSSGASPSPGPGLAIRVVGGEATKERLDVLREADHILQEEIRAAGLYRELWQSFCVLPDVRTVGVQGDERSYGYVVVIRAVTSDDAMTADWARLPYDLLERIASRMINELREVNRVVLDITSKPPGTIEWE